MRSENRQLDREGWSTTLGSDVIRDGMYLELISPEGETVAEIFRADVARTLTVESLETSVPDQIIEEFCEEAWRRLNPFEDGMSFAEAGIVRIRHRQDPVLAR